METLLQQLEHWLNINGVPADELPMLQTISVGMARFVTPTMPDIVLHGGETLSTGLFNLKVLWTPGHSPGHVSLYEPEHGILISGDYILPTITPNIGLHPQSGNNPLDAYLKSLKMLRKSKFSYALPGHESPFTNVEQRIDEIIQHHRQRNSEILATIKTEPKTAYQIATETLWKPDTNPVGWQDLPLMDKRRAMMETLSHLELMRSGGKVNKIPQDSVAYYQSISGGKNN
jgi:glyoxylase-like metal-dependent hydrolase (beta-lactamase superfamily II)